LDSSDIGIRPCGRSQANNHKWVVVGNTRLGMLGTINASIGLGPAL